MRRCPYPALKPALQAQSETAIISPASRKASSAQGCATGVAPTTGRLGETNNGCKTEKGKNFLIPSKYIEFIDHDLEIDLAAEMGRIQKEMRAVLAQEKQSQKMLEDAFKGINQ